MTDTPRDPTGESRWTIRKDHRSQPVTRKEMPTVAKAESGRLHKATYSRDKKKGGYLIRVEGPTASAFVGREVPVSTLDGSEHMEKLTKLIWSGIETSSEYGGTIGAPVALYAFEAKPREPEAEVTF